MIAIRDRIVRFKVFGNATYLLVPPDVLKNGVKSDLDYDSVIEIDGDGKTVTIRLIRVK